MLDYCAQHRDVEVCGLLAGSLEKNRVAQFVPIANQSHQPQRHFALEPHDWITKLSSLQAKGHDWVGVFHSHPGGSRTPSLEDGLHWHYSQLLYVVVCQGVDGGYEGSGYMRLKQSWAEQRFTMDQD